MLLGLAGELLVRIECAVGRWARQQRVERLIVEVVRPYHLAVRLARGSEERRFVVIKAASARLLEHFLDLIRIQRIAASGYQLGLLTVLDDGPCFAELAWDVVLARSWGLHLLPIDAFEDVAQSLLVIELAVLAAEGRQLVIGRSLEVADTLIGVRTLNDKPLLLGKAVQSLGRTVVGRITVDFLVVGHQH